MKLLLELRQDYILEGNFKAREKKTEKGFDYDWIDEKKDKAHGKNVIDNVCMYVPIFDREGYSTQSFQRVLISKDDLIKLAKRIEEIESIELIGAPESDLPF